MTLAVLFDCDGTLVDTEALCAQVDIEIYAAYGVRYNSVQDYLAEFLGRAKIDIVNTINARGGPQIPFEESQKEYTRLCLERIPTEMKVFPESVAFVRALAARGIPMAVASNGQKEVVLRELDVAGYTDLIGRARIFGVEDVVHPKPAPDLYLKAAFELNADPARCIVVEDSAAGTRAGVSAGMRVVGYTGFAHDKVGHAQTLEKAGCFKVVQHLAELGPLLL